MRSFSKIAAVLVVMSVGLLLSSRGTQYSPLARSARVVAAEPVEGPTTEGEVTTGDAVKEPEVVHSGVEENTVVEPEVKPEKVVKRSVRTRRSDLDPSTHHWHLGVCASTAFSSEWLQEWIELQLLGGVDHIWLLDDSEPGSDPKTAAIIKRYEDLGFVTAYGERAPDTLAGCGDYPRNKNCIVPKLCHAIVHQYVDQYIFADTDEFIYPTIGCDLSNHVRDNCDPNRAHHVIRWERFGTSGHYDMPEGLMMENFLSSGGDCTAHPKEMQDCAMESKLWDFCLECRHMKSMFNTKCVGNEHVGQPHIATNTTLWKRRPDIWNVLAVVQEGNESVWHHPTCTERSWGDDKTMCRHYTLRGDGTAFPPKPSTDCCAAGIGYNHYGTKSRSHWDYKMKKATRRGLKVDFDVVEMNSTVSAGILRFARAMRQRWQLLGLPVSPQVSFFDNGGRSTFVEEGWRYLPAISRGSHDRITDPMPTAEACADACWSRSALPPATSRCGGWSYLPASKECRLIDSPFNSWREGVDLGLMRWPHTAFPGDRIMNPEYVSGIPLHDGECPLPERLEKARPY